MKCEYMREDDKECKHMVHRFFFLMTTEISVQRILFGPFRKLYQGNMKILISHYTHRFHSGKQMTLTQILIITQNNRNWAIYQHPITRTTNEERVFKFFTEHRKKQVISFCYTLNVADSSSMRRQGSWAWRKHP